MKKLDYNLLKSLYNIHSQSEEEAAMRDFIKAWVTENVPVAVVTEDTTGNLFIAKGKAESYPCLCAHMDQVQRFHPDDFVCLEGRDIVLGYSPSLRKQCGLGADDKNGIFIALMCLQQYDILKCAFFVAEEIGCIGSGSADTAFFSDCRFCAQIDRRGNSDMVTRISAPLCSDEFISDACCTEYGYGISDGLMTDVDALRNNGVTASCINLSCGYYEPHTDHEITSKADLEKCFRFVCHLIEDCTKTYEFTASFYSSFDRYCEKEDEFCTLCDELLSQDPNITFSEIYKDYGKEFRTLTRREMKTIYYEMFRYYKASDWE